MELNITGNPGTGNTFTEVHQEFHINHVENLYPGVTSAPMPASKRSSVTSMPSASSVLIERQRDDILAYVGKLVRHVTPAYVSTYEQLWRDILATEEVAAEIYNPGKQQGTTFNRNLVANIIFMMKEDGIIAETNVTRLTELLEGDKDHSVRASLASRPSRACIYNKVKETLEKYKKTPT